MINKQFIEHACKFHRKTNCQNILAVPGTSTSFISQLKVVVLTTKKTKLVLAVKRRPLANKGEL